LSLPIVSASTGSAPRALPHDLEGEIARLKKERNAVILAHFYQDGDIQDLADFVGDSLQLARAAQKVDKDVIVFCGVHFMAETAKILNPARTVVVPDMKAGCSLSDGCPPEKFARFVAQHPGALVVSYINCSAAVKALSDVIVTSSNAEKIVRALPTDRPIIFAPDRHLGRFVAQKTGRDLILWNGACMVHELFSEKELVKLMTRHPDAEVLAHPECEESVLSHAHYVGSTTGIIEAAERSKANTLIIATEDGVFHQIRKRVPHKVLLQAPGQDESCACNQCPHMRLNTMEKIYLCLRDLSPQIHMDEALRLRALKPMERMLQMSA
jgi:quinolinate synthase